MKRIIAIILIAVALAGCTSISQDETDYNGNDIYNIMQTGRILELEDSSIYFTNYEEPKVYLYHVDEDLNIISKQELELNDSMGLYYLNIVGNVLYGYNYKNRNGVKIDECTFVRIKLDESKNILKPKTIIRFENDVNDPTWFIIVSNKRIYRLYNIFQGYVAALSSYNLNGRNNKLYGENFYPGSFVSNGKVYRFDSGKMYINEELFFTLDTSEYYPHYPLYFNNYIYSYAVSSDSECMIRFKVGSDMNQSIGTDDIEVIFDQKAVPINFYGDKMAFLMDEKTYLSNLDGTDKKVLFDDYESVMMTKNYIFTDTMFGVEAYDYTGQKVNLFE